MLINFTLVTRDIFFRSSDIHVLLVFPDNLWWTFFRRVCVQTIPGRDEVEFLSPLFWGGLRGNVDASCVRCWKKRGRLPIGDN